MLEEIRLIGDEPHRRVVSFLSRDGAEMHAFLQGGTVMSDDGYWSVYEKIEEASEK